MLAVVYLGGEYDYNHLFLGVPTILGGNGVESVIELPLNEDEKNALDQSAQSVKDVMQQGTRSLSLMKSFILKIK